MALLEAKEITVVRGERQLFQQLNLSIFSGEIWQIQGPNGAGKSSFLRVLVGLLPPQQGCVYFHCRPLQDTRQLLHQELLYIGHKVGIKTELTALENLEYFFGVRTLHPHLTRLTKSERVELSYQILEQLGLVGLEDVPAMQLSAGQQRRIALAQLWISAAKLWVLDEPFTALDYQGIQLLESQFEAHIEQGGSIIFTSHQNLKERHHRIKTLQLEYQHA